MKYHDSMEQAQQKMTEASWFLERFNIPVHPINYHVAYCYISKSHDALNQEIEQRIDNEHSIDSYVLEELFNRHLAEQPQNQKVLIKDVKKTIDSIEESTQVSSQSIDEYMVTLNESLLELNKSTALSSAQQVVTSLIDASKKVKRAQQVLQEALSRAQKQASKTNQKLLKIERQRTIDPLTGLYKSSMMIEHAETWIAQNKSICALAIDIDDFALFNQKYGPLVGDVVLSKIAKKVRSYVQESGLPVRVRGEEFMILLPEVNLHTATEIASQMRSGVEKLKFISSRSGKRLPKLTVSIGVSELDANRSFELMTNNAYKGMRKAKLDGKNRVTCYS